MLSLKFDQALTTQIPKRLPVYSVSAVDGPTRELEAIARTWPGHAHTTSKTSRQVNNWICIDNGQLRVMYHRMSGAVQATVRPIGTRPKPGYMRYPIDDEMAVKNARAFLGNGWFVDDGADKLLLGKVTHLQRQNGSSDGFGSIEILDAGVVFTRVIDETPVVGPGGQVMVNILPDGGISGASRVFRRRGAKVDMVRIKSAEEALAELEQRLRRDHRLDCPVRILRAQFGYFEAGRSDHQRFFEPAYAFVYLKEDQWPVKSAVVIQASGPNRGNSSGVNIS